MWTIIAASILILSILFGYGIYILFVLAEKMNSSNVFDVDFPVFFSEEKPCGSISEDIHPCDCSGDAYYCGDCELGI